MAEWLKAHAWKACIRETVSGVRIPLSPPGFSFAVSTPEYYLRSRPRPLSALSSVLNMVRGLGPFGDTIGCPGMLHSRFRIVFFLLLALTSGRGRSEEHTSELQSP